MYQKLCSRITSAKTIQEMTQIFNDISIVFYTRDINKTEKYNLTLKWNNRALTLKQTLPYRTSMMI